MRLVSSWPHADKSHMIWARRKPKCGQPPFTQRHILPRRFLVYPELSPLPHGAPSCLLRPIPLSPKEKQAGGEEHLFPPPASCSVLPRTGPGSAPLNRARCHHPASAQGRSASIPQKFRHIRAVAATKASFCATGVSSGEWLKMTKSTCCPSGPMASPAS